jgi:PAS domain S-box-containing protein
VMQSLKKFIAPAGADEGIDRRMVLVVLGFALVAVALLFAVDINRQLMGVLGLLLLVNFVLAWNGILRPAGLMVPILGMAAFVYLIFTNDGLRDTAILGLVVVIIGAGLLTGRRGTVAFGTASLIIVIILGVMESSGRLVNPFSMINTLADYMAVCVAIVMVTALQWAVITRLKENTRKAQAEVEERRRAEEALRTSEARYRLLVEQSPLGIVIIDHRGFIDQLNPAACEMLGYDESELLGRDPLTLIDLSDHAQIETERPSLLAGQMLSMERLLVRKDGSRLPVMGSTRQMPDGRYQYIFQDISARKQAEEAVRTLNEQLDKRVRERTAELEAANKELESFSYSVSHDLRAPLRAINGFSNLLISDYTDKLSAEALMYLDKVRENANKMASLIDDLLTFSRLSRNPLKKRRVDLRGLVVQVIEELHTEVGVREVKWHIGELPPCQADPSLLKQVYANLIGNALKYTRPRPAPVIEIGSRQLRGQTVYHVRDNGVGFDMKYAGNLFGVFQRLHSEAEFEGTGIGLAIVQRIVNRHGGKIWAESEVDQGATFFFTLAAKQ